MLLFSSFSFSLEKGDLLIRDILPNENSFSGKVGIIQPRNSFANFALIGTVDTVGGTYYDWQFNGPSYHWIINDPPNGVHCLWMYSPDAQTGFPNRNMRYNYYDLSTRSWNFLTPPYMNYGVNAYQIRTGFGGLSVLPSGEAVVCAHGYSPLTPIATKDATPGSGLFPDVSDGPSGYQWPPISITQNSWIHCLCIDATTQDNLYYTKIQTWPTWTTPVGIGPVSGEPLANLGPCHNINSSHNSNKVVLMWTQWDHPGCPVDSVGYRLSTDGGETWGPVTALPFPPAFTPGSETTPSFHISSIYGFFDRDDNLRFVASLHPVIRDTGWVIPAEIWHYCEANNPAWSKVRRALPESLAASVGYNAIFATRPQIGQKPSTGELVVVWEEFVASNPEPATQVLRCAIWGAASTDGGNTWQRPVLLTDTTSTVSFRFPSVAGIIDDTVWISYLADLQAGFVVQGQGQGTENPIIVHKVPLTAFTRPGVAEARKEKALNLVVSPNPFSRSTRLSLVLPDNSSSLVIYDAQGKPVKTFHSPTPLLFWNGRDEKGKELPQGIYFLKLSVGDEFVTKKLILTD